MSQSQYAAMFGPDARVVDLPPTRPYEHTDDSNARRLVDTRIDRIRFVPERRQWLVWDGHRWRWDHGALAVTTYAREVADDLPRNNEDTRRWRTKSLMAPRIQAMIGLAKADKRIRAPAATLDRRAYELNTPAGVIDLRTAQLHDPDPAALHTKTTVVAPDPGTTPTRWLRFLATTFAGQPELTTYVQRLLGVSLFGEVLEQLFPLCHGLGRNGKGVLFKVVQAVLGIGDDGYAAQASAELIMNTKYAAHPTELARLNGTRLVVTSEVEQGQKFNESRLKNLTGGDIINARFMAKDFFDFTPTHTLWMLANDQPAVSTGGYALWQRMRLIPFAHVVPPEDRDKDLATKLITDEGPAILSWLVVGAADYYTSGLAEPAAVTTATQAYEADQDTISRFVAQRCVTGDTNRQDLTTRSLALYTEYEKWCAEQGEDKRTHKAFTGALKAQHNVTAEHTRGGAVYRGIRIDDITDDTDPAPTEPQQQELGADGPDRDDNTWRGGRWS